MFTIPFLLNDSVPMVFNPSALHYTHAQTGLSAPFNKIEGVGQSPPSSRLCMAQSNVNPATFSFAKYSRNSRFFLLLLDFTETTLWATVGKIILHSAPVRNKNVLALGTFQRFLSSYF
jgi:hypothetical protein